MGSSAQILEKAELIANRLLRTLDRRSSIDETDRINERPQKKQHKETQPQQKVATSKTKFQVLIEGYQNPIKDTPLDSSRNSKYKAGSPCAKIIKAPKTFDIFKEIIINEDIIFLEDPYGPDVNAQILYSIENTADALNKIKDPYQPRIMDNLLQIKAKIDELLPVNELGILMTPEEAEVKKWLERAANGEKQILPVYPRGGGDEFENPIDYLEKKLGRFLKRYNKKEDYLYLNQLRKIDNRFCGLLEQYLRDNKKGEVSQYIKKKSSLIDKQSKLIESDSLVQGVGIYNKISSLKYHRP